MTTRVRGNRQSRRVAHRQTNWGLIVGVIGAGVLGLFALLFLALQEPGIPSLADYCQANPDRCVVKGAADAPVTVVEVSDYSCPACRTFNVETADPLDETFVQTGQARWVVLPFARPSVREQAAPAAAAALCANEQGLFFEYHRTLFDLQESPTALTREGYLEAAGQVGLEMGAFNSCLDSGRYDEIVDANIDAAMKAGVDSTPTFFINGVKLIGAHPFATFQQRIMSTLGS
ncbi:MAG: thioredoxin domain-containing protein [Chloroflexota bacterium]